jgi:hypothetical protein
VGTSICGRFGGSLSNISDSDVIEPYQDCSTTCGASVLSASLFRIARARPACRTRESGR